MSSNTNESYITHHKEIIVTFIELVNASELKADPELIELLESKPAIIKADGTPDQHKQDELTKLINSINIIKLSNSVKWLKKNNEMKHLAEQSLKDFNINNIQKIINYIYIDYVKFLTDEQDLEKMRKLIIVLFPLKDYPTLFAISNEWPGNYDSSIFSLLLKTNIYAIPKNKSEYASEAKKWDRCNYDTETDITLDNTGYGVCMCTKFGLIVKPERNFELDDEVDTLDELDEMNYSDINELP